MSENWRWVTGKEEGWECFLTDNDAPYDPCVGVLAYAGIRKAHDGTYFWQFPGMDQAEEPRSDVSLENCKQDCEKRVKLYQTERKMDGKDPNRYEIPSLGCILSSFNSVTTAPIFDFKRSPILE
jgi:hypothetical protein